MTARPDVASSPAVASSGGGVRPGTSSPAALLAALAAKRAEIIRLRSRLRVALRSRDYWRERARAAEWGAAHPPRTQSRHVIRLDPDDWGFRTWEDR